MNVPQSVHPATHWKTSWLLSSFVNYEKLLQTLVCRFLCGHKFSTHPGNQKAWLLDHMERVCFLRNCQTVARGAAHPHHTGRRYKLKILVNWYMVERIVFQFFKLIFERERERERQRKRERGRYIGLLFHFMHSLVDSCVCPDRRSNAVLGLCSYYLSYPVPIF